ncbi:hypothetical protein PAAG_12495 [Paracoccidioides lutzii Pb01]|uniref:Uncharacterized protein n=1 Tax=Paracoccidioides lutzii (strain ATCC MYA-826 / Pb01) TaxID=502779 RepID=A0A0A2V3V3_PARBA|nr:hypothetical protein PAAG_12495 [Paracoccidioides lutzii Pb01]KGQ00830.1 hypothetical protein PAAG_12495 [Paracoccidioides lutzii Pb01]
MPENPLALNMPHPAQSPVPSPQIPFSPRRGPSASPQRVFPNSRVWYMGGLELRCQFAGWKWKWSCFFVMERGILRAAELVDHARTAAQRRDDMPVS